MDTQVCELKQSCSCQKMFTQAVCPGSYTVVITFSEPVRKRRIFFFRAWEAFILTKALGCRGAPGGAGVDGKES